LPYEKRVTFFQPPAMPKPFGYSHVVEAVGGRTICVSAQVPLNREG